MPHMNVEISDLRAFVAVVGEPVTIQASLAAAVQPPVFLSHE